MRTVNKIIAIAIIISMLTILGAAGVIPEIIPPTLGGLAFLVCVAVGWYDEGRIRKYKDKEKLKRKKQRREERYS